MFQYMDTREQTQISLYNNLQILQTIMHKTKCKDQINVYQHDDISNLISGWA